MVSGHINYCLIVLFEEFTIGISFEQKVWQKLNLLQQFVKLTKKLKKKRKKENE